MIIYLSLLVSLIGVLMYALAASPKLVEIGREMFWVGLLAFLLDLPHVAGTAVSLLPR